MKLYDISAVIFFGNIPLQYYIFQYFDFHKVV